MAYDNKTVQKTAQKYIDKYNGYGGVCDRLLQATSDLYHYRDDYGGDENDAAASHYLHMRYAGARLGPPFHQTFASMILIYDGLWKAVDDVIKRIFGSSSVPTFSGYPASEFNLHIIAWARAGLLDGEVDFIYRWGDAELLVPPLLL